MPGSTRWTSGSRPSVDRDRPADDTVAAVAAVVRGAPRRHIWADRRRPGPTRSAARLGGLGWDLALAEFATGGQVAPCSVTWSGCVLGLDGPRRPGDGTHGARPRRSRARHAIRRTLGCASASPSSPTTERDTNVAVAVADSGARPSWSSGRPSWVGRNGRSGPPWPPQRSCSSPAGPGVPPGRLTLSSGGTMSPSRQRERRAGAPETRRRPSMRAMRAPSATDSA